MSRVDDAVQRLSRKQAELAAAEEQLTTFRAATKAAREAHEGAALDSTPEELRKLRLDAEDATDRERIAKRVRDDGKREVQIAENKIPQVEESEATAKHIAEIQEARPMIVRAAELRLEADRLMTTALATVKRWSVWTKTHMAERHPLDEAFYAAQRDLGVHVPGPLGTLAELSLERSEARGKVQAAAREAREKVWADRLDDAQMDQLTWAVDVLGTRICGDLQIPDGMPGVPTWQLYSICGVAHQRSPTDHSVPAVHIDGTLLGHIVRGLPRALAICAAVGRPFDAASASARRRGWRRPEPPPPPPQTHKIITAADLAAEPTKAAE